MFLGLRKSMEGDLVFLSFCEKSWKSQWQALEPSGAVLAPAEATGCLPIATACWHGRAEAARCPEAAAPAGAAGSEEDCQSIFRIDGLVGNLDAPDQARPLPQSEEPRSCLEASPAAHSAKRPSVQQHQQLALPTEAVRLPHHEVGSRLRACALTSDARAPGQQHATCTASEAHALPASIPVPGGLIYNSYREVPRPDLATFLGDLAKGDCSLMLPNNSRDSVIDFNLINVNQPNVTLSVVEDPQPHGGASGMTVAAAAETSPTAGPHFLGWKGIVAVVVGVVIVVAAAAVIFIPKHCRSSGSSPGSHSGDGQADVHGDVEKNGHLLMEVNGHKWDNGDKGTGTI
ncbi:unnamed protein product [Lampetra fluviatilis]